MTTGFRDALLRPDNLPVLALVPLFGALLAYWWRKARLHDRLLADFGLEAVRAAMDGPMPAGGGKGRLHTWPYLLRVELLASVVALLLLAVWSVLVDAPLEQMADPTRTPNPSKAPWYFVGLQELLVYFDPWIAGVLLPLLIIFGLCAVPYLDKNEQGSGFFCFAPRRFAIVVFLLGFVGLWLGLIIVGAFLRGPGWGWFWPWQEWDAGAAHDETTRNFSELFGVNAPPWSYVFGAATLGGYYALGYLYWRWRRRSAALARLGPLRYTVVAFLLLSMAAVPIKIALRLVWSIKYVLATPWLNV